MSTPKQFNRQKCEQRNLVAASRFAVDAVPLRFLRDPGEAPVTARGTLPRGEAAVMAAIHERQPEGATPLTAEQVHIHYLEGANNSFITDRYMFMHSSTLRNIAQDAGEGFAFMNSHRTGGYSDGPPELPLGRTFGGRYEVYKREDGSTDQRTVLGVYMLAGLHPNGANSPSTDDIHQMIDGGTLFDASVGLFGGKRICDLCGNDINAYDRDEGGYLCPHMPGTTRKMSEEEIEQQKGRGVPDGCATYSLVNAHCGEVSGVYDGAVTGAGFGRVAAYYSQCLPGSALKKFQTLRGVLSPGETAQANHAYSRFVKGDKDRRGGRMLDDVDEGTLERVLRRFGLRPQPEPRGETLPAPTTETRLAPAVQEPSQREKELQEQLAAAKAENERIVQAQAKEQAEQFKGRLVQGRHCKPFEAEDLAKVHEQLSLWQAAQPVTLTNHAGEKCSPSVLLESFATGKPAHRMTEALLPTGLPDGAAVLSYDAPDDELEAMKAGVRKRGEAMNTKGSIFTRNGGNS